MVDSQTNQKYNNKNLNDSLKFLKFFNISVLIFYLIKLIKKLFKLNDIDNLNCIHITGTKGKGSTCAFVESMLRGLGFKTGFFRLIN